VSVVRHCVTVRAKPDMVIIYPATASIIHFRSRDTKKFEYAPVPPGRQEAPLDEVEAHRMFFHAEIPLVGTREHRL
jgi:hypothetical protein